MRSKETECDSLNEWVFSQSVKMTSSILRPRSRIVWLQSEQRVRHLLRYCGLYPRMARSFGRASVYMTEQYLAKSHIWDRKHCQILYHTIHRLNMGRGWTVCEQSCLHIRLCVTLSISCLIYIAHSACLLLGFANINLMDLLDRLVLYYHCQSILGEQIPVLSWCYP